MSGQAPSRISITTLEGEEYPEEINLATGMTHRFYSRAFVNTVSGEQSIGAAEQRDVLNDVEFDVMEESAPGVVQAMPNGCLWARSPGQATVRLSAYSLQKGQLEAYVKLNVSSVASLTAAQNRDLGSVSNFSVEQLKTPKGTFYGLIRSNQFSVIDGSNQVVGGIQNVALDRAVVNTSVRVWKDIQNEGFFTSYGIPGTSPKQKISTRFFPLSFQANASSLVSESPENDRIVLAIRKVYGGRSSSGMPVSFVVSRDQDLSTNSQTVTFNTERVVLFGLVDQNFPVSFPNQFSSSYIPDGSGTSEILRMKLTDAELNSAIQFAQGQSGLFYFAVGTYAVKGQTQGQFTHKNALKVIISDGSQHQVETPLGSDTLASNKAFALEASFDVPQIVFIRSDKKLIFLQRLSGQWKSAQLDKDDADPDFPPKFIANSEDGTLMVAWKKSSKLYLQISKDFGANWLQSPLDSGVNASDAALVPLPCGGSGLVTVEGSILNLRFMDDGSKTPSSAVQLGAPFKEIQIFRERQMIKIFYVDGSGKLYMTSFP
ncbi:MAG: hypothetical protein HYY62_00345 [Deltaproteobacteria bacterium]|nr:hypothetical protein [Deltaproteobacteria bacterium]